MTTALDAFMPPMWFDRDEIVLDERGGDGGEGLSRIAPDSAGHYVVNGWRWTWQAVDPADCDRIAGQIPPVGEHQQYVVLTHTDMRVPHDRLRVSSLKQVSTHSGVAFTAVLRLDGKKVGTIENTGAGGPTTYHSVNSSAFNGRHLQEYTAACRRRGEPATEEDVLAALVDEYDLGKATSRATATGGTIVRLLDEHGYQLDLLTARRAPTTAAERAALARRLATEPHPHGAVWQIWAGTAWRHLGSARIGGQPGTDNQG